MGGYCKEKVRVASAVAAIYECYNIEKTRNCGGKWRGLEMRPMLDEGRGMKEYLHRPTDVTTIKGKFKYTAGSNDVQEPRRRIRNNDLQEGITEEDNEECITEVGACAEKRAKTPIVCTGCGRMPLYTVRKRGRGGRYDVFGSELGKIGRGFRLKGSQDVSDSGT